VFAPDAPAKLLGGQNVNVHLNADVSISHLTSVYLVQLIICQDCPRERHNLPKDYCLTHCVWLDMLIWFSAEKGLKFAAIIVCGI